MPLAGFLDDAQVLVLGAYIRLDRLWQQNAEAWRLLRRLPARVQSALLKFDRQTNGSRSRWDALLTRIAKDQMIFREIILEGSTHAGVVRSRKRLDAPTWRPIWQRSPFTRSETDVRRICRGYHRQWSDILGLGVPLDPAWQAALRQTGHADLLDVKGRPKTRPILRSLEGLPTKAREKSADVVLHWFAHALHHLVRYRNHHLPDTGDPYICAHQCLELTRRLAYGT